MVRFTLIFLLINNWSFALQVGDYVIGTREPGNLEVGEIAQVTAIYETWASTTSTNIGLSYEGVNWEVYEYFSNERIVSRYYLIDGNDYFGGTADYIFKIDYKVSWNVTDTDSTYSVQPQGVTVIDYQTQLDPIEYSVWLVQYKGNETVNRYNGDIFYFSTVTLYSTDGPTTQFRVEPPEVTSSTGNLSFSMEVTVVGNYAVIGTTPEYGPLYSTPVQGFVDHHLKFNVQENISISL
jgi:hypothetical protein